MRLATVVTVCAIFLAGCSSSDSEEEVLTLSCETDLPKIVDVLRAELPTSDYDPYPNLEAMADAVPFVVVGEIESMGASPGTGQTTVTFASATVLRENAGTAPDFTSSCPQDVGQEPWAKMRSPTGSTSLELKYSCSFTTLQATTSPTSRGFSLVAPAATTAPRP